ncbi:KPN_01571 family protein [Enterobacter sp.]|jgi:hypothetical protein
MNPYLWVFIVLLALDALRENLELSSFSALADFIHVWLTQMLY